MEIEKTVTRDNLIKSEMRLTFASIVKAKRLSTRRNTLTDIIKRNYNYVFHIILLEVQIEIAELFEHGKR
jgi:uncharacterized membrane protein